MCCFKWLSCRHSNKALVESKVEPGSREGVSPKFEGGGEGFVKSFCSCSFGMSTMVIFQKVDKKLLR